MKKALVVMLLTLALTLSAGLASPETDGFKELRKNQRETLQKCLAELAKETDPELRQLRMEFCDALEEAAVIARAVQRGYDKFNQQQEQSQALPLYSK